MSWALVHVHSLCAMHYSNDYVRVQCSLRGRGLLVAIHSISGWLSKNWDENPRMRALRAGILNRKSCACVNSRRNFWTTNLKSSVSSLKTDV